MIPESVSATLGGIGLLIGAVCAAYVAITKWNAKTRNAERAADVRYAREQQQRINDQRDEFHSTILHDMKELRADHTRCREEAAVMKPDSALNP